MFESLAQEDDVAMAELAHVIGSSDGITAPPRDYKSRVEGKSPKEVFDVALSATNRTVGIYEDETDRNGGERPMFIEGQLRTLSRGTIRLESAKEK